jgi:hypothetical protein
MELSVPAHWFSWDFQYFNPPLLKYLQANNLLGLGPVSIPAWIGREDLRIQEN